MNDQTDDLPARERARVRSRDRKIRGPRVVVDNPGLKKLTIDLAEKRRKRPPTAAPSRPLDAPPPSRGRRPKAGGGAAQNSPRGQRRKRA